MSFTNLYTSCFSKSSRRKGEEYYAEGRVSVLEFDDSTLLAEVRGTQPYEVSIEVDANNLNVECSCPAFDSEGYCKHLWATFLVLDAEGLLQATAAGKRSYMPIGASVHDAFIYELEEEDSETLGPRQEKKQAPTQWKSLLNGISSKTESDPLTSRQHIVYIVDLNSSALSERVSLYVLLREQKLNGEMSRPKKVSVPTSAISRLSDANDVHFLSILSGESSTIYAYYPPEKSVLSTYHVTPPLAGYLLPLMASTGRLYVSRDASCEEIEPLNFDNDGPFGFRLKVERNPVKENSYEIRGIISRGSEEFDLQEVDLIGPGLFVRKGFVSRFDTPDTFRLMSNLKSAKSMTVPNRQAYRFIKEVAETAGPGILDLTSDLEIEVLDAHPRPHLVFQTTHAGIEATVSFVYGEETFTFKESNPKRSLFDVKARRLLHRDLKAESRWRNKLEEIGLKRQSQFYQEPTWRVSKNHFPEAVRSLLNEGCVVHAEGKHLRSSKRINVSVTSGIDWFELDGAAEFEGSTVKFPDLLAAVKRGENLVELTDGTYGLIPEEWLRKYGTLVALGEIQDDHLRYKMNQAFILDTLLAEQPEVGFDSAFEKARDQLRSFNGIHPIEPPVGFVGNLRDYQKDALGWMKFLRDFGFGGCLADDMGLGKTVMVLAMLQSRRLQGTQNPASLVVVPRSLVFNWIQEASRFAPALRILDYTGILRKKQQRLFHEFDVVITTYGTLRSDAAWLKDQVFDYIILDEAQMVKNASTASAKAVRLIQGNHRLALSGTPVQNHLGDIWSLFDFLNKGMLGASSVLNLGGSGAKIIDEQTVKLLAKALRPFILRRTKEQVAKELPAKVEQTIFCELATDERKLYDELRDHYRQSLLSRVDSLGISSSKIQVLEALLRLRQAACHPGLIDHTRTGEMSTKLEALIPQLMDVMEEGHKALVFSQFVSFLTILRHQLDAAGVRYEYLDGQTVDRQTPVETFQNDSDCKLFLVSLKAGGLGLNLTAADYVFLLDPWWNPVIEAQAIDRAHRIGQSRQVFAYRIIARDTVEEKVLQLQETKRNLADAIITADNSVLRKIEREDLELLLS